MTFRCHQHSDDDPKQLALHRTCGRVYSIISKPCKTIFRVCIMLISFHFKLPLSIALCSQYAKLFQPSLLLCYAHQNGKSQVIHDIQSDDYLTVRNIFMFVHKSFGQFVVCFSLQRMLNFCFDHTHYMSITILMLKHGLTKYASKCM